MVWDLQTPAWRFTPAHGQGAIMLGNHVSTATIEIGNGIIRSVIHGRYIKTDGYSGGIWTLEDEIEGYADRANYRAESRNYILRLAISLRLIRPPTLKLLSRGHYHMIDHSNSIGTLETDNHGRDAEEFEVNWSQSDVELLFQNMCPEKIELTNDYDNLPVIGFDVSFIRPIKFSDLAVLP